MRIRTKKDVEKLDNKIKDELGVDVQKYRNQEVIENFVELLVFPKYVINWVFRPLITSLFIYFIGFFILDLVHIEFVIYGVIGLILFLLTGFLIGLLFLMWKMKKDIWEIINYSLDIMKSAVLDVKEVNSKVNKENRKEVLGLLFKGIIHIVTIPMMSKVVSNKIPIIGGVVSRIVKKVLILIADKIKFDEVMIQKELNKSDDELNILKVYLQSITSATKGLENIMEITFSIAKLPFKIALVFMLLFIIPFLYFIN